MTNILVTGGSGRLGKAFKKLYPGLLYPTSDEMDLSSLDSVNLYFQKLSDEDKTPDVIIHLAAMTGIPQCENNKEQAYKVNVQGTRNLAWAGHTNNPDVHFIYLNTACVFDGEKPITDSLETCGYTEDDMPYPKNYYGLTKLLAEETLKTLAFQIGLHLTITRTNFTSMPWEYPKAFTDRFGTYLFAQGVASALYEMATYPDCIKKTIPQIVHVCGARKLSMYDYAVLGQSTVEPMTLADYKGAAKLTQNMCLRTVNWHPYLIEVSSSDDRPHDE